MDAKFIYVFTEEDRNNLIKSGFYLVSSHEETSLWVFSNDSDIGVNVNDVVDEFTYGNTLMF